MVFFLNTHACANHAGFPRDGHYSVHYTIVSKELRHWQLVSSMHVDPCNYLWILFDYNRATVMRIMRQLDPEGVQLRKKRRLKCRLYSCKVRTTYILYTHNRLSF